MSNEKPVNKNIPLRNQIQADKLPIFFFQTGNNVSLFFDKILKQAELSNGKEDIYVLTDANFDLYTAYNCIDISKYRYSTAEFDKVYEHHSINKFAFEKACFDRWFIMNAIAREQGFELFFYADCDVLILEDLKPVYQEFIKDKYQGSTMFFENGLGRSITSGHTSFWSLRLINDFCDFVNRKFSNKAELNVLIKDAAGGKFYDNLNLSDMILLDTFRTETKPAVLNLLALEPNNICFDFNLNASYNGCKYTYAMHPVYKIKKMFRKKDGLYGRTKEDHPLYFKFYTLHFQGYLTKALIPAHIASSNYAGKLLNELTAKRNFTVRKLRLLKNHLKSRVKKIVGK